MTITGIPLLLLAWIGQTARSIRLVCPGGGSRGLHAPVKIPSGPFSEATWAISRFTEAARRPPTNANTLMSVVAVFPPVQICQTGVRPYAGAASRSDPVGAAGALTASRHTVTSTVSPSIGPPPDSTGVSVRTPKSLRFSLIPPSNPATSP